MNLLIINEYELNKTCRVCLQVKTNLESLNSSIEVGEARIVEIVADVIKKIAPNEIIENDENFPTQICTECVDLLKSAYLFKLRYEESTSLLKSYLETFVIKEEKFDTLVEVDVQNDGFDSDEPLSQILIKKENVKVKPRKSNRNNVKKVDSATVEIEIKPVLHECPVCTLQFSALDLRKHIQTHKALQKYLSIPSNQRVSETQKFFAQRGFRKSFFQSEEIHHQCPYCDEVFPVLQFRQHVEQHRKQTEYKCDKCERVFRKINHLNIHRIKHMKECPYKCEHCGKGFVIKKNYDCHILIHSNDELPHECSYCLKRFSNPEHLHRHQIIHTENVTYSVKYRVCKCYTCLKTFKDASERKNHKCVPIDQGFSARYPCTTCNKVFKHSSGLYNHNRNIHKLKGAKTLCSVCGNYVSNIYNHMMRHTGEKPYQCNQCDKKFTGKPQLRQHLLVHSGLKPYVCSVCAKAFNNLYNLQVHERIHKGNKCHICNICNKGFLEKSYLKKHMNVHKSVE